MRYFENIIGMWYFDGMVNRVQFTQLLIHNNNNFKLINKDLKLIKNNWLIIIHSGADFVPTSGEAGKLSAAIKIDFKPD